MPYPEGIIIVFTGQLWFGDGLIWKGESFCYCCYNNYIKISPCILVTLNIVCGLFYPLRLVERVKINKRRNWSERNNFSLLTLVSLQGVKILCLFLFHDFAGILPRSESS